MGALTTASTDERYQMSTAAQHRSHARARWSALARQTGTRIPTLQCETHVDGEHVYLVLSPIELDILVDALRSVGNVEFAEQLEAILRQLCRPPAA